MLNILSKNFSRHAEFSFSYFFYAPTIFNGGGGGGEWGGGAYSITAVCTSVPSVPYVTLLVSVRYLLKGLVYWIEILYTGI